MAKISQQESEDFRRAMENIAPFEHNKITLQKNPKKNFAMQRPSQTSLSLKPEIALIDIFEETVSPESKLFYARSGLQHALLREFQQGKINICTALDLHGMALAAARESTADFIEYSLNQNFRCVKIIHGKGHILKNALNGWLRQIESVLAFCSALPRDGGTGAVYVLLKRH